MVGFSGGVSGPSAESVAKCALDAVEEEAAEGSDNTQEDLVVVDRLCANAYGENPPPEIVQRLEAVHEKVDKTTHWPAERIPNCS